MPDPLRFSSLRGLSGRVGVASADETLMLMPGRTRKGDDVLRGVDMALPSELLVPPPPRFVPAMELDEGTLKMPSPEEEDERDGPFPPDRSLSLRKEEEDDGPRSVGGRGTLRRRCRFPPPPCQF